MLVNVKFYRVDYAQVGTTNRGCMRLIHSEKSGNVTPKKKAQQPKYRIVVGANSGILLCLERKADETKIVFKTNPGPPISFVRLGGALHTIQDKTFAAAGETVRGYSKKGKQFLSFESNMAETISSMYVYGVDLFLAGRNTVYQYHDCEEKANYMCTDKITDIICLPSVEGGWVGRGVTPLVACEDKTIKVLQNLKLQYEVILGDIPSTMHLFMNDGGFTKQKILYGTKNGRLGLLDLGEKSGRILWEIATSSSAAISAIYCHRLTENTHPDIVVGKEDGVIDIYTVDDADKATFRQNYNCDESITALECIRVEDGNYDEIIVCTYTGWVFGLSTEQYKPEAPTKKTSVDNTPSLQVKVQKMQSELDQLELKVKEEREKYHEMVVKGNSENKEMGTYIDTTPHFHVNDRFTLNKDLACYTLTIELAVPIEYVFLQSDVNVELMDVEKNSAVISVTPPDPQNGNQLLAVYRCQADITRMEMRIRSIEGQFGTLKMYIVPRLQLKTCQLRSYPIKPLALHERVHHFDETRPLNVLTFTGNFSINEAHSWLVTCVSQIPERCPGTDTVTLNFQSTFNGGTMLQATYSKGKAIYRSDNLSTIIILRDVISKLVTNKQLKVQISCEFNDSSVEHTLRLIHPKMEYQAQLAKKVELASSLKELKAAFGDVSYLNAELTNILLNHDKLYEEAEDKSIYFDRIVGIIVDLFIDRTKVNGLPLGNKANDLLQILHEDYTFQNVLKFFEANSR
ncbi:unnamed protein product [Bursaphelenchus xylophilus]|uniref:(pine wood nematode) hypothetical protein n=1 Tax=Bursaphelenchus xylophilus TaxID=6326 RepID=A0A1I7SS27_BURXY|nr:unnamed protein product [Bursaphelenchus xylophilus]CAG9105753.1 unnamed protein product [Bursaphelenchus xylophilus]